MKFVEKIRAKLDISKYEMAKRMGITPQAYHSLTKSSENISLKALVGLRSAAKISDRALLDAIEGEWSRRLKQLARMNPDK